MKHRYSSSSEDSYVEQGRKYENPLQKLQNQQELLTMDVSSNVTSLGSNTTLSANSYNIAALKMANNQAARPLPKIAMPMGTNKLNLGVGVPAGLLVGADGNVSVGHKKGESNNRHLASSPLIMGDQAVKNFFSQYIPAYYANNPWLLSPTFEIHQYKDLKNLNLYIYKTLRILQKDDINHPTQPRNIKMKEDLNWDLKIDRIASCYMTDKIMTNVIAYVSYPKESEFLNSDNDNNLSPNSRNKKAKKHLLGIIKATQSYTMNPSPRTSHRLLNGISPSMMANSVTHTPRTSGIGSALGLRPQSATSKRGGAVNLILHSPHMDSHTINEQKVEHLGINVNQKNSDDEANYYSNDSDDQQPEIGDEVILEEEEVIQAFNNKNGNKKFRKSCCNCCSIHNLRSSLIFHPNSCKSYCDSIIYWIFYKHGYMLSFFAIYFVLLTLAICERIFYPLLPYENQIDLRDENGNILIDNFVIMITGRIMLMSLILMIISRMSGTLSWLNKNVGRYFVVRLFLDNFIQHEYVHLILSWIGIISCCLIHILFVLFTPFSTNNNGGITSKTFGGSQNYNQYYVYSVLHEYSYADNMYLFDIIRVILSILSILGLILSNLGGTYYSLYATSLDAIKDKQWSKIKSVLCNKTYDFGHQKKRHKVLHILSALLFVITFYLDLNYLGVYIVVSLFILLLMMDRLYFIHFSKNIYSTTDLNIVPIDHQFKLLFVNNNCQQMIIEPGDTFYISASKWFSLSRSAIFFSKNNYHSIGCIMRVHRNNTLSCNMERVKWNFNFLEKILDNEVKPIFRGPFRNNIYNRLIWNIQNCKFIDKRYVQYLIAVDEGIAYQIEYLTYLQSHNYSKMPYPTHIVFATSSKSLFNYISTNLQLLFIEMEDLTVECKLLPSNINLIPNISEMVQYYKNEKIKEYKKELTERRKQKEKERRREKEMNDWNGDKKDESDKDNDDENENDQCDDIDIDNEEELTSHISDITIMQEMEYDILHYLSIPHILYHHNLKAYYENHQNSKLSKRLNCKYDLNHINKTDESKKKNRNNNNNNNNKTKENGKIHTNNNNNNNNQNESCYDFNEDIEIEMYYSGIPFVSNVLKNVCQICRIPYYTQKIY